MLNKMMNNVRIAFYTMNLEFELINTYRMAAFESISNILGKFSPAQRLLALILLLITILGISLFQFKTSARPECETLQQQLTQTQNQLTTTISSQSTFIHTIDELRQQTFDLNSQISKRDSIILAINGKYSKLSKLNESLALNGDIITEPLRMMAMTEPYQEPILAKSMPAPDQNLNNPIQYEEPVQSSPAVVDSALADIGSNGKQDTITTTTTTSVSKSKVSWLRRVLGRKN